MRRSDLVLALLASAGGHAYTPVQIQKAAFLVTRNIPAIVSDGPEFQFEPYDFGPFDSGVYSEAESLARENLAIVAKVPSGRYSTYAASPAGITRGEQVLDELDDSVERYIREVSGWVRAQSFRKLVSSIYRKYPEMRVNSIFKD